MAGVGSVMDALKGRGTEKNRAMYVRHGMAAGRALGVSVADLKVIAKGLRGQQEMALGLYETGILDAMYLAGMVANGAKMSRKELQSWANGTAGMHMISEYTVPWVTVESEYGRELATKWIASKQEHVASSGWCSYSGLATTKPDTALDLAEMETLLGMAVKDIHGAPNRVKVAMNGFVISVGSYVRPLLGKAKAAAEAIGEVSVDMGDTACTIRLASEYLVMMEAAGKIGKKRKTIRC